MNSRPSSDIEIDTFVVWEEVVDTIVDADCPRDRESFDAMLVEATDFSSTARLIIWDLAQAMWKAWDRSDPNRQDHSFA